MLVKRKLYSVMDEEGNLGYYLYDESNGEERMFNKAAYEGLTAVGKDILGKRRSAYAKDLYAFYRKNMKDISNVSRNTPNITNLSTRGTINAGGVKTNYRSDTTKGTLDSVGKFTDLHKGSVRKTMLKGSKDAADIMRRDVLAAHKSL